MPEVLMLHKNLREQIAPKLKTIGGKNLETYLLDWPRHPRMNASCGRTFQVLR